MSDIWFISDTHFFHDNIIHFCGRPFANSDLMNECLIQNWNEVVKPQDKVYHLGDVACGNHNDKELGRLLSQLNGHKRLIVGNHDNVKSPAIQKYFDKIQLWNGFYIDGIGFTTSHIPLPLEHLRDGKFCVHGHIHNHLHSDPHYINVCVEHTGYGPMHIDLIAVQMKKVIKDEGEKHEGIPNNSSKNDANGTPSHRD